MAALLIFKLLIPFMLVVCTFTAITKMVKVPLLGCYFLVIICSDIMTVHFFFLVRNTGSWMEIGNSISHFGIMSAQVVFVLLLFAVTTLYTKQSRLDHPNAILESICDFSHSFSSQTSSLNSFMPNFVTSHLQFV
ncbi:GPI ethanolamine phosphate transferase 1-like [Salvia splendens]|uniref:GPI ethanolamine phosphate transferase 1-like n=1 Tax=Salvia splendens TaxID=180675 RepID=UPI001C268F23|nr:GPI ethanolamine phosphate transferase 1-like [Salvia splendens]